MSYPSTLASLYKTKESAPLLLLSPIQHDLHIPLRYLPVHILHHLLNIITDIPLHRNLFPPIGRLCHATTTRELLPKVLGHLFQVIPERIEA